MSTYDDTYFPTIDIQGVIDAGELTGTALSLPGRRDYLVDTVYNEGKSGHYWSFAVSSNEVLNLLIEGSNASMYIASRAWGFPVRCILD